MQILPTDKALRRRRILRLNILAASLIFLVSVTLTITGDYATLQERRTADTIYNLISIVSLIYMALVWISCVMTKPLWFPEKSDKA